MSETSPSLSLPYIMPSQAQKHVTHNEAIRMLDALAHLSLRDRDLSEPPATPTEGDRYLVATEPSGAWAGFDGWIAAWQDGNWNFFQPREGWLAWLEDEQRLLVHHAPGWSIIGQPISD